MNQTFYRESYSPEPEHLSKKKKNRQIFRTLRWLCKGINMFFRASSCSYIHKPLLQASNSCSWESNRVLSYLSPQRLKAFILPKNKIVLIHQCIFISKNKILQGEKDNLPHKYLCLWLFISQLTNDFSINKAWHEFWL